MFKRETDRHSAVADRRRDPLDRAAADVADGENTRLTGLQYGPPPGS
jgi:hypothetical protein